MSGTIIAARKEVELIRPAEDEARQILRNRFEGYARTRKRLYLRTIRNPGAQGASSTDP